MKRFKKIYIEITNVCNLSCSFCPKTGRAPLFMDLSAFQHLLRQAAQLTDHIYLHLMGEPLLHPQIAPMLQLCHSHGLFVNLTTNGTLIDRHADMLLQAPALRKIAFSLHSYEANHANQTLNVYLENIARFVKRAQDTPLLCALRLWNADSEERPGANTLNGQILLEIERTLGVCIPAPAAGTRGVRLRERLFLEYAQVFEWPVQSDAEPEQTLFCYGLRDQIGILADGTVVPCCLDSEGSIALGNALETPLAEIVDGPRARRIYDGFSARSVREPLCARCTYARRFRK